MGNTPLDMTITMEVKGKEGFKTIVEYKGTTIETVVAVQNKLLDSMKELNNLSLK